MANNVELYRDILISLFSAGAGIIGSYMAFRKDTKHAMVEAEGIVLSGYEKLVDALQSEVDRLSIRVTEMEARISSQDKEIATLRQRLSRYEEEQSEYPG